MRRLLPCLLCALAWTGPAAAWTSPAPDVVLYCPPALAAALTRVSAAYTAATRVEVHIFIGPAYRLAGLLKHRARDDVVVSDAAAMKDWAAGGLIHADSVVQLGRNPYVLVARADAAGPRTDAAGLLAAHQAVLPDPTTAADFDGAAVLRAALPGGMFRTIGVADSITVLDRVRADGALLGVVQASEAGAPLVHKVASLAAPPAEMAGAIVTEGQSGNARALLAYIAGPDGQAILRQAGLETGS